MVDVGTLRYQIEVDDAYRRQLAQAGTQFRNFGRQIDQTVQTADRSASQLGSSFQDAAQRADRAAQDTTQAWRQAGSRAEGSADGVGSAWREAGGRAESAASGIGSAWRQAGSRAEGSADAVGAAWRQAGTEGEQAAVGVANAFQQAMERASGAGENAGATSGGSFVAAFGTRLSALASRAGPIGAALAATVGIGTFFGAQIADKVYEGFQIQADRDFAQASFGFNDQQMAAAGEAAGKAYGNAWGASVQDNINTAGTAIQAGLLDGDATAAEMQPVIETLTFVSSIMGEEIPAVARAAGQMIKTNMVDSSAAAFDLLTAAQQRGLNLSEDVLDTMNEYGTTFRKLGIDGPQAFGLISQAVEGGARDVDIAADAIKEFGIRVVDGSELTTGAFDDISESVGMTADEITAEFGKGGEAANTMADKVIDAIRSIEDPLKRNEVGVALFGTQWEDMGDAINKMDLSTASQQLDSVGKAADGMTTAGQGAASGLEAARNKITVAADEMKVKLAEAFAPTALDASAWVTEHQDEIVLFFANSAKAAIEFTAAILDGAGGFTQFASIAVDATTHVLKYALWPFVKAMEKMGSLMSLLPGNAGEMGEKIRDNARDFDGLMTTMTKTGGAMRDTGGAMFTLADKIRDGSATLDDFIAAQNASMQANDEQTAKTYALVDALNLLPRSKPIDITAPGGTAVRDLLTQLGIKATTDNHKNIVVESPLAPPVLDTLRQLGIEVVNNNGKNILVTSNAPAVKTDVDNLNTALNSLPQQRAIEILTNYVATGTPPPRAGTNNEAVDGVLGAFPDAKASGGPIAGPGGPRSDDVPIWASNGEFMMKAAAVEKYGMGFMHAVNAGKFADGGAVDGSTAAAVADPGAATVAVPGMGLGDALGAVADTVTQVKQGELDPAMTEATAGVTEYGLATQEQTAAVQRAWTDTGTAVTTAAGSVINPAVAGVGTNLQTVAGTVINPTLTGVGMATQQMGATVQTAAGTVINPAFQSVGATVQGVHTGTVDPVLAAMRGAVDNTAASFGTGAAAIGAQWSAVREATAAPVRFTIGTVFNNGLVGMWNSVSQLLGTPQMNPYPLAFATGGEVRGPGGPTDDKIPAVLSNGEFVLNARATRAAGVENLRRFNAANGSAGPEGMFSGGRLGFATGGLADPNSPAFAALKRGHEFARQWSGRPYVWGGSLGSDGGTDCSGWQSSIADVILGGSGMQRQWATGAFPGGGSVQGASGPQGFTANLGAGMAIGVSAEHTAGTLGGVPGLPTVNIESGGTSGGTGYGGASTGADSGQFPSRYHLPIIDGMFMSGGGGGGSMDLGTIVNQMAGPGLDKMMAAAAGFQGAGTIGQLPTAVAGKLKEAAQAKIAKLTEEMSRNPGVGLGGGVERWRPMAIAALKRNGFAASDAEVNAMLAQIQSESSGNPSAIQTVQDVNSGGNEAAGLLQIAKGTWPSVRDPSLPDDRMDPWANMNAALRYIKQNKNGDLLGTWGHGHGYALGGTVRGQGAGDVVPAMLTPGEEVVRKAMADKHRTLLKAINADEVGKYADGGPVGFGGYTGKSEDSMKPKNFYDWAALTAGLGFTAASVVEPYLGMASSKRINLGDLAPTIDTGSNSIPGLMDAVNAVLEPLQKQLEEQSQLLAQIRDKKTEVTVNSDSGPAAMLMGSRGL